MARGGKGGGRGSSPSLPSFEGFQAGRGLSSEKTGFGPSRTSSVANQWGELPEGWTRADLAKVGGVVAAELAARGFTLHDAALIVDVMNNRAMQPAKQYGTTLTTVAQSRQFSANINKGKTKGAYDLNKQVARAIMDKAYYDKAPAAVKAKANVAVAAIQGVVRDKTLAGVAKGATFYDNKAVTAKQGTGKQHRSLESQYGSFTVKGHTFTGTPKEGFNVNAPDITPDAYAKAGLSPTYDGTSLGPFGLGGWQDQQAALAATQTAVPDVSMASYYGGNVPPSHSLADLGGIPDRSTGSFYDSPPESLAAIGGIPDRSTGSFYGESYPEITAGIMDQPAPQAAPAPGPYDFGAASQTSRELGRSVYDGTPYDYGTIQPDFSGITAGILDQPSAFQSAPLGAPQGFANYGDQPLGYSPTGFSQAPTQPQGATLAALGSGFHAGTGLTEPITQGPSLAEMTLSRQSVDLPDAGLVGKYESEVSGRPAPASGLFAGSPHQMGPLLSELDKSIPLDTATVPGITGYTTETRTRDVPNPAYADWADQFGNKPGTITSQQMYADEMADKIGVNRGNFAAPVAQVEAIPAAPPKTTKEEYTVSKPEYGNIPATGARPSSATITAAPQAIAAATSMQAPAPAPATPDYGFSQTSFGKSLSDLFGGIFGPPVDTTRTNFAQNFGFNQFAAPTVSDPTGGAFSDYAGPPGSGMLGSLNDLGIQGFSGTIGTGLTPSNEGYSFSGSQGSDPTGRGGLY